jgi:predicted XRE-type DNA-binding protein
MSLTAIYPEAIVTDVMLSTSKLRQLRRAPVAEPTRLRTAMTLAGVTQTQVAEAVGIAQSQVSEDAAGKFSEISLEKARKYATYFGCAIEDLFPSREAVAS